MAGRSDFLQSPLVSCQPLVKARLQEEPASGSEKVEHITLIKAQLVLFCFYTSVFVRIKHTRYKMFIQELRSVTDMADISV